MSLLLALVSVCSPAVWYNNIGTSTAVCPSVLKMVPLGKIHLATPASELYNVHAVLTPKAELQHNNHTSKTFLRGNLQGDSRQRGEDMVANDSSIFVNVALYPPSSQMQCKSLQSNEVPPPLQFGSLPFDQRSTESAAELSDLACSRTATCTSPTSWLALPTHALLVLHACSAASLDVLMSVHIALVCAFLLVYALALLLAVCARVLAVILDVALSVVGLILLIAHAHPMIYVNAFMRIIKACIHMIRSGLIMRAVVLISILALLPSSHAVGRDAPAVNAQEYLLPGLQKWDGIPFHTFRLVWWIALCAALGNIGQDGWTLLQTARDQDAGGPTVGGTPTQRTQSANRNQRLFGAMLNYIDPNAWVYRYAQRNFANNGRGLFNYLWVYGHLPYTSDERTVLENEWTDATMSSANIRYTPDAVFKWAEYIDTLADKLNKSERDKRVKYLAGFPSSFDVMIVPERARGAVGSYTHPANYPAHHPNAGTPHALAGQPDIHATALGFYSEWARMIRTGSIRSVPRGMANRVDEDDDEPPDEHACNDPASCEHVRMARERVTMHTICLICGGAGHAGYVDGLGQCLSARLNHRIPPDDLAQFRYPSQYKTATRFRDYSNPRSNPAGPSNSNPGPSRLRARVVEPPPSDESSEEEARYTSRTHHKNGGTHIRYTNSKKRYSSNPRPRPRPAPRRKTARHVVGENENESEHIVHSPFFKFKGKYGR